MLFCFILICFFTPAIPCCALPFLEEVSVNIHAFTYETNHFWNKQGHLKPSYNHFKQYEVDLCIEYSPVKTDIFAITARYDRIQESMNGNTNGFGDAEFSWVHRLSNLPKGECWCRLLTIIPTGKEKASLRYGRLGAEADLFYSSCFTLFNYPIGALCGIGYRMYHGFPSDQLRAYLDLTSQVYSNLYWLCQTKLEYGVFNGKRQEHFNQIILNPNYRLFKVQLSLVGYLADWIYLDAGYFQHIWGENVGNSGGFIGGLGFIF
jgi:hypothetical protein